MLTLTGLSQLNTVLLLLAIAGVTSWGITQIIKGSILWYEKTHGDKWWFNTLIRVIAIVVGCVMGYILMPTAIGFGLGFSGGVLNTTVIAIVKTRIKGLVTTDTKQDPPPPGDVV